MSLIYKKRNIDNIVKLADHTREAALKWHDYCVKNNINVLVYETIRTKEKQAENVRNGVSQTMRSYHLVGQALDFVPVDNNGKTLWNGYGAADIKKAIAYAKSLGFEWGGDWKSFKDQPHLQFNYKGYGTDTFTGDLPAEPSSKPENKPATKPIAEKSSAPIVPYPGKVLKVRSKGKDVERIQRAVKVKADGVFGEKTKSAVKSYQKRHGLSVDGIVGKKTWSKMFG